MANLATNLAKNLATNLATDVAGGGAAGGTWRDDYPTLEDYWPTINTTGDDIVGGNLDQWVGRIAGWTYAAPSAVQRPTPGANGGWQFASANSITLEAINASLLAMFEGKISWSEVIRLTPDIDQTQDIWAHGSNSSTSVRIVDLAGSDLLMRRSVSGAHATATVSVTAPVTVTLGFVFDAVAETLTPYVDGVAGTTVASTATMPSLSISTLGSLNDALFMDAEVLEALVFSSALDGTAMADIHSNLVTDYP